MKTNLITKISAVIIVAAAAVAFVPSATSGEVVVKRGGQKYETPGTSLFAAPRTIAAPNACVSSCKREFVPTQTQDTKLKTKTLLVEKHACNSCSTTIKSVGAQKATGKNVATHSCAGKLVTLNTGCCLPAQ
jgi:hypothetical protein